MCLADCHVRRLRRLAQRTSCDSSMQANGRGRCMFVVPALVLHRFAATAAFTDDHILLCIAWPDGCRCARQRCSVYERDCRLRIARTSQNRQLLALHEPKIPRSRKAAPQSDSLQSRQKPTSVSADASLALSCTGFRVPIELDFARVVLLCVKPRVLAIGLK